MSRWSGNEWRWLVCCALAACDKQPESRASPPATAGPAAVTSAPAPDDLATHAEHDDAHAAPRRPAAATVTSLSADARARVTTLRISAHVGSVTIRKSDQGWTIGGPHGCVVSAARVARALQALSDTHAERSDERAADFELQVTALIEQERVLHFDVAGRTDGKDLVQLPDYSAFRVSKLDRGLFAPEPSAWCAPFPAAGRPTGSGK